MPWWGWLVLVWANSAVLMAGLIWMSEKGMSMSQVQSVVDAVVGQLTKVRDEIVARLDEVEAQIIDAGVAEEVDLSGLQAIADALDAIVPDAAVEAEVEVDYEGLGEVEVEVDDVEGDEEVAVDEVEEDVDVAVDEAVEVDEDEEVDEAEVK